MFSTVQVGQSYLSHQAMYPKGPAVILTSLK
jgi:hypothetical protein